MSNLLIIDIQNTYAVWISNSTLVEDIPEFAKNFSNIIYLWDNGSDQELYDEIPEEWLMFNEDEESENFYDSFNKVITKQYGFFRDLMDSSKLNISSEDIVALGKFMNKEQIADMRDIYDDELLMKNFKKQFKNNEAICNINFNDYIITFPSDLADELKQYSSYVLVGGGLDECLKEVSILLEILEIPHTIELAYCY